MHELRSLPLRDVLAVLTPGATWKTRKNGTEFYGKCVFHKAVKNSTSFSFSEDGRFFCFSCLVKGKGAIDLVMRFNNCTFKDAVEWLGHKSTHMPSRTNPGEPLQRTQEKEEGSVLQNEEFHGTYEKYAVKSEWLEKRGLTEETLRHFGVFEYSNPTRQSIYKGKILIPIRRYADSALVGYLARSTEPNPETKYLFPKNLLKHLEVFGASNLREALPPGARLKVAFLVESPFAVMKFYQLGFPAVSCYGWAISSQQVDILQRLAKGWIFLPDANKRDEALKHSSQLYQKVWLKCPEYPGSDPEHLTKEQILSLT